MWVCAIRTFINSVKENMERKESRNVNSYAIIYLCAKIKIDVVFSVGGRLLYISKKKKKVSQLTIWKRERFLYATLVMKSKKC